MKNFVRPRLRGQVLAFAIPAFMPLFSVGHAGGRATQEQLPTTAWMQGGRATQEQLPRDLP